MTERMGEQPSEARQPKAANTRYGRLTVRPSCRVQIMRMKLRATGELGPHEEVHPALGSGDLASDCYRSVRKPG